MRQTRSIMHLVGVVTFAFILLLAPTRGLGQEEATEIDAEGRAAIVEDVTAALNRVYIFADVAAKMEEKVKGELASGAYDDLSALPAFCERLTEDLQSISHDLHLRVRYAPPPQAGAADQRPSPEELRERRLRAARRDNFCFRELELLAGNVGYLKLDCFMGADIGGATAIAAMNFLSGSDALIFDLRENGGGAPSMIQLISSYLFEEPTHLNSFYIRETDETDQFWTQAHVEGARMTEPPVFVLTSGRTFSAAEEFTYNLKHLERATIVGETTGGGAHPVRGHEVEGYPVRMSLPFGRAVNPVTGTNWEGTGVGPHIEVAAGRALDVAHLEALTKLEEMTEDDDSREALAFSRLALETHLEPLEIPADELRPLVGAYGPRRISLEDGTLFYRRDGRPNRPLLAAGEDRFFIEGVQDFYLRFERDSAGRVVRVHGHYLEGRRDQNERSDG